MTNNKSFLASGHPSFDSTELASVAANQGSLAAWQQLITTGGWDAVKSVAGDFAVGFHDPAGRAFLAVDRFAIRSLCYRVDGGQLRFAARADELADARRSTRKQFLTTSISISFLLPERYSREFTACRRGITPFLKME